MTFFDSFNWVFYLTLSVYLEIFEKHKIFLTFYFQKYLITLPHFLNPLLRSCKLHIHDASLFTLISYHQNQWSGPDFLQEPKLNQTFLSIFYDSMPRCFIGSGLNFNLFSLSKRQNMNYVPNNIFGLCFNFSCSTTSVLRYKIESKRCYKISDVPAGMHLVVLLLYRNSQHWNSISSLCCHPTSLRLRVRVLRVWESAERGACGGVRSEVNITRWTWQLDHVPAPDRQGVCQGRLTNVTAFFKPLV